jgi:transcriptional regulator with GAF, ATPase, and Fis domain
LRRGFDGIVGRSRAMQQVFDMVRVAASVDDTALITGESGCGKELVARAIHEASPRSRGPLLVVDCSGLAEHLLESELFGHIAGAFTGATGPKAGAFEAADGGTVFLDEISDAPLALQQMLRRVLQEGEIRRVGDTKVRKVDVRVICATNKDLPGLVKSGSFLPDLYHRINLVPIRVPPLRDRREDIPDLVRHFLEKSAREASAAAAPALTQAALDLLVASEWKENNIRELRNVVKLSAMLARGKLIDSETIENVLRIQRGEAPRLAAGADRAGPGLAPAPNGPGDPPPHCAHLVQIHREAFQDLLRTQRAGDDDDEGEEDASAAAAPKRTAPFYLLQLELATRAIVEGLRACRWKLRPAARLLGISPMKLRGTLKESLAGILARHGGDLNAAAASLDIPLEVLERKAGDLGLEDLRQ